MASNGFSPVTYGVARKYVDDSMQGAGAVRGKPCQIQSIDPITGGSRVTFLWEDNAGTQHTSTMDVKDGDEGPQGIQGPQGVKGDKGDTGAKGDKGDDGTDGKGIKAVTIDANEHLIITYTDDTTTDAGKIEVQSAVQSVNGKTGDVVLDASDVGALQDDTELFSGDYDDLTNKPTIPAALSDLTDDSTHRVVTDTEKATWSGKSDFSGAYADLTGKPTLGTAAAKDSTNAVTQNSTDLVESGAVYTGLAGKIDATEKGANNGVAELDSTGKVPSAQLPSYVDDVLEYASQAAFPATGETGKIYVATDTNKTYRWSGSAYVEISESLALGETSSTAYAGNKGKANADAIAAIKDGSSIDSFGDVETALADKADASDIPDITGKADKVSGATSGNFAALDANGNLTDSGKSASDFATPEDIEGQQSLLKDTVGWTGKNLLKNKGVSATLAGVTFTVNSDGSVTTSGTSTASVWFNINGNPSGSIEFLSSLERDTDYIYSGVPSNAPAKVQMTMWDVSDLCPRVTSTAQEQTFFIPASHAFGERTNMSIGTGDAGVNFDGLTFYPMIRKADIADPTYEPYHESVETMYEEEVHGVNLLKNGNTTKTLNGVTFTVNSDKSVTVNGTSSGGSTYTMLADYAGLGKGAYLQTGCPAGGTVNTYLLFTAVRHLDESAPLYVQDVGEGAELVIDSNTKNVATSIIVRDGTTVNNLVFRPMIRKADIDDSTYRPYNEQAIQNQINDKGVLGAKNLADISKVTSAGSVTFNSNGGFTVTGDAQYAGCRIPINNLTVGETYIASVKVTASNISDARYVVRDSGNLIKNGVNFGDQTGLYQFRFTYQDGWYLSIVFNMDGAVAGSSVTVEEVMLRLASDPDDTYQPYAMTNRELTEKRFEKRTLTSNDDLNNITEAGIYGIATQPSNSPVSYATLIVNKRSDGGISQLIQQSNSIYTRAYGGETPAWTSWYKFTGTVVS